MRAVPADRRGMRSSRRLQVALAAVVAAFACAQLVPATFSSFTDATASSGNTITAAADWTAPSIAASVLQKSDGGTVNKFHAGETFYLYASAADTGNPAAGLGALTAITSTIATVSATTLTAGSYTVAGTAYNYRSPLLTAKSTLSSTSYSYSLSVSDTASNGPTTSSGTVVSDNTAFNVSSYVATNVATPGKALAGDKLVFTYNRAPEPDSLYAGWDGTSKNVSVKLSDGGLYGGSSSTGDLVGVMDAGGAVTGLGYVTTGGNYVSTSRAVTFANSTMVLSGAAVTVTLGTPDNSSYLSTDTGNRVAVWNGAGTAIDQSGNGLTTTSSSGISRVQF